MHSNTDRNAWCLHSKGISFVELVVAIALAGIIAAFAVPRLTHIKNDVRASEVIALSARLRNAAATAHEQYLQSGATLSAATLQGRTVQLKNGYPDAGFRGIRLAIADLSEFTVSFTPTSVTYSKSGAPIAARCAVTYTASPAAAVAASITDPKTSGC
jgi:type II secretory pathway pseudopilin PulG